MLKPGDKVVFIGDDSNIVGSHIYEKNKLSYGEVCEIYTCFDFGRKSCLVTKVYTPEYEQSGFMTLKDYRKQKLKKIETCSTLEIK